jgi:cell division protein FtsW
MGTATFVKRTPVTEQATTRRRPQNGDLLLAAATVALCLFGLLILYSASTDYAFRVYHNAYYIFNKQVLWVALGATSAFLCARMDYHRWRQLVLPAMALTIGLLVVVLFVNETRHGAARSILGGSVQPSELAKLVLVLYLAVWLDGRQEHLHDVQLGLLPLAAILGLIGGLIYLQPDLSATATIFVLGALLFFLAGGELRQIVMFMVVALLVGWVVVQFSVTGRTRLADYLAGLHDPLQSSYHVKRALEAIIKGGWFGVGIGRGTTKLTGLPWPFTDSIFAVLVEEQGFFGALVLMGLYGILLWRGIHIAQRAPDMLGMVMAGGLTFWIIIEALINISVMIGLLPFAGNTLPFISAGGSNLVASLTAIGILLGISRQAGQAVTGVETERRLYGATVDLRRRDRRRRFARSRRA